MKEGKVQYANDVKTGRVWNWGLGVDGTIIEDEYRSQYMQGSTGRSRRKRDPIRCHVYAPFNYMFIVIPTLFSPLESFEWRPVPVRNFVLTNRTAISEI